MMTGKKNHNLLRINVGFLLNQPVGTYRDIHFEPETFILSPEFVVTEFTGLVRISRTRTGILAQMDVQGEIPIDCVRCLEAYSQLLRTSFSELFAFKKEDATDSDLILPEDGYIDLAPLAYEYLILETPMLAVCRPDCKGLCPVCGTNFNKNTCPHMDMAISSGAEE